jgi:hypothetical protein
VSWRKWFQQFKLSVPSPWSQAAELAIAQVLRRVNFGSNPAIPVAGKLFDDAQEFG